MGEARVTKLERAAEGQGGQVEPEIDVRGEVS